MNSEIQTNRDTFGLLESLDLLDCETKKRRRHALFHTDDSNKNFLHLAIEAHETFAKSKAKQGKIVTKLILISN